MLPSMSERDHQTRERESSHALAENLKKLRKAIDRIEAKYPGSITPDVKSALLESPSICGLERRPTRYQSGVGMFFSQQPQFGDAVRYVAAFAKAYAIRVPGSKLQPRDAVAAFLDAYRCTTRRHLEDLASSIGLCLYPKESGPRAAWGFGSQLDRWGQAEIQRLVEEADDIEYLESLCEAMEQFRPFLEVQKTILPGIEGILRENREYGAALLALPEAQEGEFAEVARKLIRYYGRAPSIPQCLNRCLAGWSQPVIFTRYSKSIRQMVERKSANSLEMQRLLHHLEYLANREGINAEGLLQLYEEKLTRLKEAYPAVSEHLGTQIGRVAQLKAEVLSMCTSATQESPLWRLLEAKLAQVPV